MLLDLQPPGAATLNNIINQSLLPASSSSNTAVKIPAQINESIVYNAEVVNAGHR
jgi:hypothetical protein